MLKKVCRDDIEALDMIDKAVRNPIGANQHKHVSNRHKRPAGTTRGRALRRLRDHRPDLHARVLEGELSPHRAMIEAVFRSLAE
jgi:hypothetical protein